MFSPRVFCSKPLLGMVFLLLAIAVKAQKPAATLADCDSLSQTLKAGNIGLAYKLSVVLDGSGCPETRWRELSAEALIRTGRLDEALEIMDGIENAKCDSLRARVKKYKGMDISENSFTVTLNPRSDTTSNELLSLGVGGDVLVLRGRDRLISEFPIEREYENIYRLEDRGNADDPVARAFRDLPDQGVYQLGPAYIMKDSSVLVTGESRGFFNRSSRSGLTIYKVSDDKNRKPQIFDLADPGSIYAHPAISANNDVLVLSSDRPGGYGGMDLWASQLGEDGLGALVNLGPGINSAYNEVFPVFFGDTLFFATDDPARSLGGYDLLRSDPIYESSINPGPPLNSPYDDFCAVVQNGKLTEIISNRLSFNAKDNVYDITPIPRNEVFDVVYGHIKSTRVKRGSEVQLVNSDGVVLERAYADADGNFSFTQVKGREMYEIVLANDSLNAGDRLSIFDADKNLVKEVKSEGGRGFRFELLSPMDYLLGREVNKDESMLTVDIMGRMDNGDQEMGGMSIILQDKDGNVVGRTSTDRAGAFEFENVNPDSRYSIKTEVTDPDAVIRIYNDNGDLIKSIEPTSAGEFVYVRLDDDEKLITITNEARRKITISDKDLFNLPAVYYEYNSAVLTDQAKATMDKLLDILRDNPHIRIELSGHTDSRGAADYNLKLSEQRIASVIDYLVAQGIAPDRMEGKGYGESKLLNRCGDGVECTEDEHAANRRTEIRILEKTPQ